MPINHIFIPSGPHEMFNQPSIDRTARLAAKSITADGSHTGSISSRSGFTAAHGLNFCEREGLPYLLIGRPGQGYFLKGGTALEVRWHRLVPNGVKPPEKQLLLVCGDSGYRGHRQFLTAAYYDESHRPRLANSGIRWLNVQGDELSDKGWHPSHWAEMIGLPPIAETDRSYEADHVSRSI